MALPKTVNVKQPQQPPLQGDAARDFSGGVNQRDAPSELAKNEAADSWNIVYDERGGIGSRLGYSKYNPTAFGGGLVQNLYVSQVAGALITQAGASLYKGTSTTLTKTFTTSARVGFADFNGKLYAIHPVDGLFSSTDGVTYTAVADVDAPKGNTLEVWQNKLYAAGNPAAPSRVYWSDPADGLVWTPTSYVDLRTIDDQPVVNLNVASGVDVSGRVGLLCFKQESSYRIYDSTTGAYEVVDATIGTASSLSVVSIGARIVTLCKHGVFWWANGQVGMQNAGDRLRPLWQPSQIDLTKLSLWAGGQVGEHARFSLARVGAAANDLALEYNPTQDWISTGSNAHSAYATTFGTTETQYGGSPSVGGQVYTLDLTGADDGVAIPWRFQTRWYELNTGFQGFLWQLRVHGRGSGTLTVRRDYSSAGGDNYAFALQQILPIYDSGLLYDAGNLYGEQAYQSTQALYTLGLARQFSLVFSGSSTGVGAGRQVLSQGVAPAVGYFGLYGLEWLYTRLGLA